MLKKIVLIAIATGLLFALHATPSVAALGDPFRGVWESVDLDESNQKLAFRGTGDTRELNLHDDNATGGICASGSGWVMLRGTGAITGNTIAGTFDSGRCQDGTPVTDSFEFEFIYDPETDELTDLTGVVWSRP